MAGVLYKVYIRIVLIMEKGGIILEVSVGGGISYLEGVTRALYC